MTKPLPMPPMDLRVLVGPTDEQDFDNPTGRPVYPDLPASAFRSVFDFGCGCGRTARQLIQQSPQPARYVGVDPHPALVAWASANLTPAAPGFTFVHHDVYSPGYAPKNSPRLADRFPVENGSVSLAIAHSVFTHLSCDQAGFYLAEIARVLAPDGVAFTSWFFFDNASTPFFKDGPHALYADEKDFSAAVLFDRNWLLAAVRQLGLMVTKTNPPQVPGHQWEVWLAKRTADAVDNFPTGAEASEYLCGATLRPRAAAPEQSDIIASGKTGSRTGQVAQPTTISTGVPPLYGPLVDLIAARREADELRREVATWQSRAIGWRILRKLAGWIGLRGKT